MSSQFDLVLCRGKVYLHSVHRGKRACIAQHHWTHVNGAMAYLSSIKARLVGKLGIDGVSGRYEIESMPVRMLESDVQAHLIDSFMTGEI